MAMDASPPALVPAKRLLFVSPWTYRLGWLAVVAAHVTKLLREFGYVEDPAMLVYQEVCMNVTALDVDHRFVAVMTTSILVAAGHGLAMVLAITRSIHSRQLCFEEPSTDPSKLSFYTFRIGFHLYASRIGDQATDAGCILSTRPWFSSTYTCTLVDLSCSENVISGHHSELKEVMKHMSIVELRQMIISDCPELEMPREIQVFPNLQVLIVHNSSLVRWDTDAAITNDAHPVLEYVYIIETNLSDVFLHDNLPSVLHDIGFSGTNLTSFPDETALHWSSIAQLELEASPGTTSLPPATSQLAFCNQVSLVGNPLTQLPATIGAVGTLGWVDIAATNVEHIPGAWLPQYSEADQWILSAGARLAADEAIIETDPSIRANASTTNVWNLGTLMISCLDTTPLRSLAG
ncbi:hypothetical protein Poli38472_013425 [Pythium oligandrum]|uniref:Uncharacterized protein n=1 Tax=Pythium oligandrum TaxID=41045 RepID=A0A8K1C7B1_PYTOL|nr:hypothetical protein Poli38472_013425 [Pythium oligandrum]|eukprot:TMW57951.1 hypothetical protein Poli38472_013425 [Pythium oligandrum]